MVTERLPKILIVDDEPDNIRILSRLLKDRFKIMAALNGAEALELVFSGAAPELILLDIMMPGMDGYEMCRRLKADPRTHDIPVIFITARDRAEDEARGFEIGSADYITKPFNPAVVEARINTHLELKRHRDHLEAMVKARTRDLQSSELQLSSIVDAFQGFIYVCEKDCYHIDFMNQALKEWAGDRRADPCHEILFGQKNPCSWCPAEHINNGETLGIEIRNPLDGKWYYAIHSPVFGDDASIIKRQAVLLDITERKQKEEILSRENRRLKSSLKDRYRFGDIIGKSAAMQQVYENILKAADSDANVVIYGESGTGKELVARAIYDYSSRQKKKMVSLNCGAIPENLAESEFFGHRKGAFTGADSDKTGVLEEADGGVLFLDEVGEIPLHLQVKLLRAIEGSGFSPLGSRKVCVPDVRIIAATNRDLKELAGRGAIRKDFFYRLHIIPIYLPPLRERKEDIPLLVEHFMNQHPPEQRPPVGPDIMKILLDYEWSGNVRELQNTLQRYVTLKKIDLIGVTPAGIPPEDSVEALVAESRNEGLPEVVEKIEKKMIRDALAQNRWRRDKTAGVLKINRKALYRKMKQYGLLEKK